MSKNYELVSKLDNNDNNEAFSIKSSDNDNIDNDNEINETEEETKNRLSLEKALKLNNNEHAFEKINKNISNFCSKIRLLQDYSLCLGSNHDSKEKGAEIEKIILETADNIAETFNFIEIIKNFEYNDRNQKIKNITKANSVEDKCNKYKKTFDDLTDKIKQQNLNLIKQARNSLRYSNLSDFSGEIHLNDEQTTIYTGFENGKEFLDGIEMKRKQNNAIYKAAKKIERSLSRRNTIKSLKINFDNNNKDDNNMEIFNIKYNDKKNDLENHLLPVNINQEKNNYEDNNRILSMSRASKVFHDMEDKVYIALEGPQHNFFRRHWLISLLILIILIIILIYYLINSKKN